MVTPSIDDLIGVILTDGLSISIEPEKTLNNGLDIDIRSWAVTISHAAGGSVRVVDSNLPAAIIRAQRGIIGTIIDPFKKMT